MNRRTSRALIVVLAALALVGCSPLIGLFVRAAEGDGGVITDGQTVRGSTAGRGDRHTPSCTAGGSDVGYVFIPERSGTYAVDVNAGYDCVVAVFDQAGSPMACNDDAGSTNHSRVEVRFEAGNRYVLAVDGYRGATGRYEMTLQSLSLDPAPGGEGGQPADHELLVGQRGAGDTSTLSDTRTPPCGATPGSPDETWTFRPRESGTYRIDVDSEFDGVLALYPQNGQTPLECNDDHGSTRASQIIAELAQGAVYEIVVDGYRGQSGAYGVEISRTGRTAPPSSPGAATPLRLSVPARGDTTNQSDDVRPGCGSAPGTPDQAFLFTPPAAGRYRFRVDAQYDSVLAVYPAQGASPLDCNDDMGSTRVSQLDIDLAAGQQYRVVVDGWGRGAGPFTLVATALTGPGAPPPSAGQALRVGQAVSGNTNGRPSRVSPGCGSGPNTPDETWTFTPPVTGQYRVHVDGQYDSVLAVYPAGGSQVMICNDDFQTTRQSRVEITLNAGQSYDIVVDGFSSNAGAYTLRVDAISASGAVIQVPSGPAISPAGVENITALEATCGNAPVLQSGLVAGRITGTRANARVSCGQGGGGGDAVYRIQVQHDARITITAQSALGPLLELRDACSRGHSVVSCADGAQTPQSSTLTADVDASSTYYLIVDTRSSGNGTFTLDTQITPRPAPTP